MKTCNFFNIITTSRGAVFCSRWRGKENLAALNSVPFLSTLRKEYWSKLLDFHSKEGRCNFWGFLHCDDRIWPWRAAMKLACRASAWLKSRWHHDLYTFLTVMPVWIYCSSVLFCLVLFIYFSPHLCFVLFLNTKINAINTIVYAPTPTLSQLYP